MLSYRHAFHAGNHADVLKHLIQLHCLQYMVQKDKPLHYIDTHAGTGLYSLESDYAQRSGEAQEGIFKLWGRRDAPKEVVEYLQLLAQLNQCEVNADASRLKLYPGSPCVAEMTLRPEDKLRFFELHPTDKPLLEANVDAWNVSLGRPGKRAMVQGEDGINGLRGLLPPASRRAFVLIDPPYEMKTEYADVRKMLEDAVQRFATGTYAVWYPQLQRSESAQFPDKLKKLCERLEVKSWCHAALTVRTPNADGRGLHSSGMFVLNPPWTLHDSLKSTTLPYLKKVLGQDAGASFTIEQKAG